MNYHIPHALFNACAKFNPYQYKPFSAVFEGKDEGFQWNGKNLLITDEVGVGKTFEAGIILQEVLKNNPYARILLVCPVKLAQQWESQLREHFFLGFSLFEGLEKWPYPNLHQLTIVPYSQLHHGLVQDAHFDVLLLDEAHYIRNQGKKGSRYGYVKQMVTKKPESFRIFMTATPIFNTEEDYQNITGLLQEFDSTTTLQGEANLYDFQLEIQNVMVSLPEKTQEQEMMNMVMDDGFGNLTGFLKRIATSSLFSLGAFLEKRQLQIRDQQQEAVTSTGEEWYFDSDLEDLPQSFSEKEEALLEQWQLWREEGVDSKYTALFSLLKEIQAQNPTEGTKGVVLFSCFLSTGSYLTEKLTLDYEQAVPVFQVNGSMDKIQVKKVIDQFATTCKANPQKLAILICSDALKEGQNFQFCQHLIHYDFPYTPAALGQRNGRIYRTGQVGKPKSYYLMVEKSYDYRLFGEIIVSKAAIVENFGKEGKISVLQVLPKDSKEFLEDWLTFYFQDQVQGESEEKVFYRLLEQKFSLKKESIFPLLPPIVQEAVKTQEYEKAFALIFSNVQQEESLLAVYENNYQKQLAHINRLFFGKETSSIEDTKKAFVEGCQDYLQDKNTGERLFCHDLYAKEELDFPQYQKQFKALCMLERD